MGKRGLSRRGRGGIRIIGGEFRGRKLAVPDRPELRPTGDRLRETLFNWIAPRLPGSQCLDLFSGTGALALEAASRGADRVMAVERDRELAGAIRRAAADWGAANLEVACTDASAFLAAPAEPFDIVFLDPPFQGGQLQAVLDRLGDGWLAPRALVYVETDASTAPDLPAGWEPFREKRAGQVAIRLFRVPAP